MKLRDTLKGKAKALGKGLLESAKHKLRERKEDNKVMSDFNRELRLKERMELAEATSKMRVEAKTKSMSERIANKKKMFN